MNKFKMPDFYFEENITKEQLDFFNQYGIIQFKHFIDKETVSQFLHETEQVQNELLKSDAKKVNGIPLKFGADTDGSRLIQRIAFTSFYSKKLSSFLKGKKLEKILDLMGPYEGRIGENEKDGLVFNHYVNTADSKFTQLGWHTDSPRDLFLGSRILPMLNIGLHLDDCHSANGGLRVIPGTHKQSLFSMLFRKKYFVDNRPDKKEAGFDIEAGDLTVHDGRLWHRVQQSSLTGAASRRRVLYFPAITGSYRPKNEHSATPFYHKLAQIKDQRLTGKLSWARLQVRVKK
ncbi:MAG: phytanoyl-CoA dioxygenase family protein [Puia sp.]